MEISNQFQMAGCLALTFHRRFPSSLSYCCCWKITAQVELQSCASRLDRLSPPPEIGITSLRVRNSLTVAVLFVLISNVRHHMLYSSHLAGEVE
jgi:hypothetical protein